MAATAASSFISPLSQARGRAAEDGAADREALAHRLPGGERERRLQLRGRRVEPEQQDAAAVRVAALDHLRYGPPLGLAGGRGELPPVGVDADVVEPLHRPRHRGRVGRRAAGLGRDHLQQQLVAGGAAGLDQGQHLPLLLLAQGRLVVRVVEDQALHALVDRPLAQVHGRIERVVEAQRPRARLLDGAADPAGPCPRPRPARPRRSGRRSARPRRAGRRRPAPPPSAPAA